jgi:hypothetical protein
MKAPLFLFVLWLMYEGSVLLLLLFRWRDSYMFIEESYVIYCRSWKYSSFHLKVYFVTEVM